MLAQLEAALEAALKASPLSANLKAVGTLPAVPDDKLGARLAIDAPALFVIPGALTVREEALIPEFTIAAVVRNAGGQEAARRGDGITAGLDDLLKIVLTVIHEKTIGGVGWRVERAEMTDDDRLYGVGINVMGIRLTSPGLTLEDLLMPAMLDDFNTVRMDMDIPNFSSEAERTKWLQDNPDYSQSRPDAQAIVQLNP